MPATLASHRGRGVHGARIARRVADAAPSYRNMTRLGFRVGCL